MNVNDPEFNPRFKEIFLSYLYLIRRGLFLGVAKLAPQMHGTMLDFGCGRSPYKPLFKVDSYIGIDINESGHADEDKRADVIYDGSVMPFENESFDCFICSEVIEHVFDLDHVLTDLARVLRRGGMGIITTPFIWPEHEMPFDYARYSRFGLKHALQKNGFDVVTEMKMCPEWQALCQLLLVHVFSKLGRYPRIIRTPMRGIACMSLNLLGRLQKPCYSDCDSSFFLCHVWLVKRRVI